MSNQLHRGHYHALFFLLLLLLAPPPATAQLPNTLTPPPPDSNFSKLKFDKSMAIVLVVLVVAFFALGFLSVYTRQCAERRMRGRFDLPSLPIVGSNRRHRGIDQDIIDTFPTFVYATVKGHKIGRTTLECAVCLNEFQDDETLRLIPKCSHVFHPECIDAWLANHPTCPVCRANLFPAPGEASIVTIQIQDPESDRRPANDNGAGASVSVSPKVEGPIRSSSTGFRFGNFNWFPRSHSTGHSLLQPGDSLERFTLRLPDEVRSRLVSFTPSRSLSHPDGGAPLPRQSSLRRGYRTRSVGAGTYLQQYERFGRAERRGFNWTPPFLGRAGSTRSSEPKKEAVLDIGERSSDRLFGGGETLL